MFKDLSKQNNNGPFAVGVDLGGTKIEIALVNTKGKIISSYRYPTAPEKGNKLIIQDLITCINDFFIKKYSEVKTIGVGMAGQINFQGKILSSPNLKWVNVSIKQILERELNLPVTVTNDVRAATWGEWRYGFGRGVSDLVVIFVGTGVGGGVISGGKPLLGCSNSGGELGHITIVKDGRKCHCPNYGCLEAYAGGWAIAERAKEMVELDPKKGKYLIKLAGKAEDITAATVSMAYNKGDILANQIVQETGKYLSTGIVGILNIFNPCTLVFGGGVIEGIPDLISIVEKEIKKLALKSTLKNLKVVKTKMGQYAGVIGAASLAQRKIGLIN